jgi:hypothetical protein
LSCDFFLTTLRTISSLHAEATAFSDDQHRSIRSAAFGLTTIHRIVILSDARLTVAALQRRKAMVPTPTRI